MDVNEWFFSLPPERQAVLHEDKWMLANAVAQAATEAEREACSKVCEALYDDSGPACDDHPTAYQAAEAIRMRANV